VAAELHDEVGQSLTGLSLLLDNRDGLAPELFAQRVAMARQVSTRLMHTVRQMSLDLRPAMLDDYGLLRALSALFERYEQQTDVLVRFTHSGLEARLPAALEVASYRIIQEALTNVARHARVREASVAVQATAHDLTLQISDRGSGFLPHVAGRVSTGLAGMKERARALGGIVHVESSPDAGTVVTAVIPITQKAGEDGDEAVAETCDSHSACG
jgi:signal transduction histidine kinase